MTAASAIRSAQNCRAPFVAQNEYGAFDVAFPDGTVCHCDKEQELSEIMDDRGHGEWFLLRHGEELGTKKYLVFVV